MSASSTPRRRPTFPGSLTDLHRFRKTAHGHDGSSRIVMVRKTDQRTFASVENGQEPTLETITRETVETFRGQKTECKVTTETKDFERQCPRDIIEALADKTSRNLRSPSIKGKNIKMDFQTECLRAHNDYRKKHGVPPLKLNKEICGVSQQWADTLITKNALQHSNNNEYGENLFSIQSTSANFQVPGREPVDNWYDEIRVHNFGLEPKSLSSGHFSQVVWRESRELGVAFARKGGKVIVVANYFPAGNIIGHFSENVPPLLEISNNNNDVDISDDISRLAVSSKHHPPHQQQYPHKSQSYIEENFDEDFLEAHNLYRRKHGVLPLKLDRKLSKYAEEWAKHLAMKNTLEHRPGSNYGENIYCLYSSDPYFTLSGHTPVDTWYDDVKHHSFGREPSNLKSGHFTQVIWRSSEHLGVGVAKNSQGSIYVVANYSPAGNFVGHYVENCPPLKPSFYDTITPSEMSRDSKQDHGRALRSDPKQDQGRAVRAPAPRASRDSSEFSEFAIDALKVHNEYRKKHGAPALTLSQKLCEFAQEWANTCALTSSLQHRANSPYGENIFSMYSSDYSHTPSARDAVKQWYDEVKQHTFGVEKVQQNTLHFSQLIWVSSRELGIGFAKNKKGQTFVVANYDPRGNCIGKFVQNVPPRRP